MFKFSLSSVELKAEPELDNFFLRASLTPLCMSLCLRFFLRQTYTNQWNTLPSSKYAQILNSSYQAITLKRKSAQAFSTIHHASFLHKYPCTWLSVSVREWIDTRMIQSTIFHIAAVVVSLMEGCHGDYHAVGDYTSYANYYPEYNFNYSAPISSSQKRIFSDEISLGTSRNRS